MKYSLWTGGALWSVHLIKDYFGDQTKKKELGRACDTCGRQERCIQVFFWWGKLREREHLEEVGADGEDYVKTGLQEVGWGGMDWIDLACDTDLCRAHLNALVNLGVT